MARDHFERANEPAARVDGKAAKRAHIAHTSHTHRTSHTSHISQRAAQRLEYNSARFATPSLVVMGNNYLITLPVCTLLRMRAGVVLSCVRTQCECSNVERAAKGLLPKGLLSKPLLPPGEVRDGAALTGAEEWYERRMGRTKNSMTASDTSDYR